MKSKNLRLWSLLLFAVIAWTDLAAQNVVPILVKDICPTGNSFSTSIEPYRVINKKFIFLADDCTHGYEWWISDGSTTGTTLLADIFPGATGQDGGYFTKTAVLDNNLFFHASDSIHGHELWITDGTTAGTMMVKDITPGINRSYITHIWPSNGKIYFAKSKANGGNAPNELWTTDGTSTGTYMVKDVDVLAVDGIGYNGRMYFTAETAAAGYELWSTDGTDTGTRQLKDIRFGPASGGAGNYLVYNDRLYFTSSSGTSSDIELMRTDGTDTGTVIVKDLNNMTNGGSNPRSLTLFNGLLYFVCRDSSGYAVYKTNGTAGGTFKVAAISQTTALTFYNNRLYLSHNYGKGNELCSIDDQDSLRFISDIFPGNLTSHSNPHGGVVYKNKLFFLASPSASTRHLFYTDGSDTGTHRVISPTGSPAVSVPVGRLYVMDSLLLYGGNYGSLGTELYKLGGFTDTTGQPPTRVGYIASSKSTLTVYPNPASQHLNFLLPSSIHSGDLLRVYDVTGKMVGSNSINLQQPSIDISKLIPGIYYVRLQQYTATFQKR